MKFCYNTSFTLSKHSQKDLDPSFKMDLDIWDCLGRKKLCLIAKEIWVNFFVFVCCLSSPPTHISIYTLIPHQNLGQAHLNISQTLTRKFTSNFSSAICTGIFPSFPSLQYVIHHFTCQSCASCMHVQRALCA